MRCKTGILTALSLAALAGVASATSLSTDTLNVLGTYVHTQVSEADNGVYVHDSYSGNEAWLSPSQLYFDYTGGGPQTILQPSYLEMDGYSNVSEMSGDNGFTSYGNGNGYFNGGFLSLSTEGDDFTLDAPDGYVSLYAGGLGETDIYESIISNDSLSTRAVNASGFVNTVTLNANAANIAGSYVTTQTNDYGIFMTDVASASASLNPDNLELDDGSGGVIELNTDNPSYFEYGDGITTIEGGNVTTGTLEANLIIADSMIVSPSCNVPDYVFEKGYALRSLKDLESYVDANKHLPDVPAASEMQRGVSVGAMDMNLLKSVEEMTLHVIELNKRLDAQEARNQSLEAQVHRLAAKNP